MAAASLNEHINRAGRQRMLGQRMAKAWLAIGLDIQPTLSTAVLRASVREFDGQLAMLVRDAPQPAIHQHYLDLQASWQPYRRLLLDGAPAQARVTELLERDAEVLDLAHRGTQMWEALAHSSTGRWVNVCGRQRMLSQQAAKFYFSQMWQGPSEWQTQRMAQARTQFAAAMQQLCTAARGSERLMADFSMAQQQWVFFDNALQQLPSAELRQQHALEVWLSSEHLLDIMDHATHLFVQMG